MAQLFETLCMMLAFKESHSLAMHYCRLVWDVRSLSYLSANSIPYIEKDTLKLLCSRVSLFSSIVLIQILKAV